VSEVRRVIIDTDPGIDDTMAIMLALASPELRVEGLTTVRGNVGVEQCARNALTILEIAGHADIPVAVGADKPLARPYHGHGSTVHGQDGLGETGCRVPARSPTGARSTFSSRVSPHRRENSPSSHSAPSPTSRWR